MVQKQQLFVKKEVSIDIDLHIRHETALKLQNEKCLITAQYLSEPLLGRPILEVLALNIRYLFALAAGLFAGSIDADSLVGSYVAKADGSLARVMEGLLSAHGGEIRNDYDEGSNEWCDISTETD